MSLFATPQRRLILHFDMNKTILMSDVGAGISVDEMLNSMLSECAWGVFDSTIPKEKRAVSDWKMVSTEPTSLPPPLGPPAVPPTTTGCTAGSECCCNFGEYLEMHTSMPKKERKPLKTRFTDADGVGSAFKADLDRIKAAMMLPASPISAHPVPEFLECGYYHILPSFFHLLSWFEKRPDLDIRIVVRTFGVDTANVAKELNAYCEGKPQHVLDMHVVTGITIHT
jgi:hypothetical protein